MRREAEAGGAFEVGGEHRVTPNGLPGPFGRLNLSIRTGRMAIVTGLLGCLGFAALGAVPAATAAAADASTDQAAVATGDDRAEHSAATRSINRITIVKPKSAIKKTIAQKAPVQKPKALAKPAAPAKPKAVAGLTPQQTANAKAIIEAGQDLGMPRKALVIALSTAMQESNLQNLGSTVVPESRMVPNEGLGSDHDSVGLFQQRAGVQYGWGPVKKLMQPKFAATQFYKGLQGVRGWQNMPVTIAAQSVQVSAYPYAYAKHEAKATAVVNALG